MGNQQIFMNLGKNYPIDRFKLKKLITQLINNQIFESIYKSKIKAKMILLGSGLTNIFSIQHKQT